MCNLDVHPICQLDCPSLAFPSPKRFKFPFWVDAEHFALAVVGEVKSDSRIVIFQMPSLRAIASHRSSHPEQVLQSTLFGEQQHSLVSFDVSELVQPADVKYVTVHVPPAALPAACEGTVARIEQQVMQARVQAMLPSKSALESAMQALQ